MFQCSADKRPVWVRVGHFILVLFCVHLWDECDLRAAHVTPRWAVIIIVILIIFFILLLVFFPASTPIFLLHHHYLLFLLPPLPFSHPFPFPFNFHLPLPLPFRNTKKLVKQSKRNFKVRIANINKSNPKEFYSYI